MGSESENKESKLEHGIHKLGEVLHEVDLAEAPISHTEDPALDPKNQHEHADRVHGFAGHSDEHMVYTVAGLPPRLEPADVPHNHLEEEISHESSEHYNEKKNAYKSEVGATPISSNNEGSVEDQVKELPIAKAKRLLRKYNWVLVLFLGLFFTSWWISIVARPKTRSHAKWLIPTFLWLFLMIRFITFYVRTRPLLMMANWIWVRTFVRVRNKIPEKFWTPIEALCLAITVLVATFATPETADSLRKDRAVSFFGYVVIYFAFWVFSHHKRQIKWHTVITGMFLQFVIALFVLRTKAGFDFFNWISFLARKLLNFSGSGAAFLTSQDFVDEQWFVVTTLCAIIFFIAFIHIWLYYGILQWFVGKFAQGFYWLMQISGAEAVVVAATPFVGQGESAVLIKPLLPHCTEAEIFQIMTSGFATVAGSVLASYVAMGVNPATLVTSCVMSIPASVAAAKLVLPETEATLTGESAVIPDDSSEEAHNVVHAFSNGAWMGIQIAIAMAANLLSIISLVALIDALLTWFGKFWGIPELTLEQIMGYIFYPVSFLIGVSRDADLYKVAKLLGTKIVQNEFVAYDDLFNDAEYSQLSLRSQVLATYALCGFSNIGTCGIQLGVLAGMAPKRKGTIASRIILALLTGCFCTFTSACVAGMLMTNLREFDGVVEE